MNLVITSNDLNYNVDIDFSSKQNIEFEISIVQFWSYNNQYVDCVNAIPITSNLNAMSYMLT